MDNAGPLNETENNKVDILQSLVDQLDFLSTGSATILEFPQSERLLHETRVPTILLDWARTILLNEWDGRADFDMDGPFGGALSFIETLRMCMLLLANQQDLTSLTSPRCQPKSSPSRGYPISGRLSFRALGFDRDACGLVSVQFDTLATTYPRLSLHLQPRHTCFFLSFHQFCPDESYVRRV